MNKSISVFLLFIFLQVYCNRENISSTDVSSFSNIDEFTTTHIHFDWIVDFEKSGLYGSVILNIQSLKNDLKTLYLDAKSLNIIQVEDQHQNQLQWVVEDPFNLGKVVGLRLAITLVNPLNINEKFQIQIIYNTLPDSTALSWVSPSQTVGKKYPYLYSQCQPIYCRTLAPLQDSPSIKSTYTATVKIQKELNVYMSAKTNHVKNQGKFKVFEFEQKIPISSYLIAIVAGNLEQHQISKRTNVVSEVEVVTKYSKQLKDMEAYLNALEQYMGEYPWESYGIAILPPNFIYGGMENPLMTFACQTILTSDKSETVIHEMAHSWMGNLVTCKSWESFWINEGLDKFLERKANKVINGPEYANIDALINNRYLEYDIKSLGENQNYTSLTPDLYGVNPDDVFSTIPYEKGFQFLTYIEKLMGETEFQKYLKQYVKTHQYKSLNSTDFENYLKEYLYSHFEKLEADVIIQNIDFDAWLRKPGYPPVKLNFQTLLSLEATELAEQYIQYNKNNKNPPKYKKFDKYYWSLQVWFLEELLERIDQYDATLLKRLHRNHPNIFNGDNAELLLRWFKIVIKKQYNDAYPQLFKFLQWTGRLKYVKPLFKELKKINIELAIKLFKDNYQFYHPVTNDQLQKILEIKIQNQIEIKTA